MRTALVTGLAVLCTVLYAALVGVTISTQRPTLPEWVTTSCASRFAVNCHGSRHGHDYIVRQVPGSARMICVFYTDPAYARSHDYCS